MDIINDHWVVALSRNILAPQERKAQTSTCPRKLLQWDWEGLVGQEQLLGIQIPLLVLFKSSFKKLKTTTLNTQEELSPTPASKTHWFKVSPHLLLFKSVVFVKRSRPREISNASLTISCWLSVQLPCHHINCSVLFAVRAIIKSKSFNSVKFSLLFILSISFGTVKTKLDPIDYGSYRGNCKEKGKSSVCF